MASQIDSEAVVRRTLNTHLKAIWRFAFALCGQADTADDLLQATCLRALEKCEQVTEDRRVDAWCMTICRSIWLNELRSQSIRKTQSLAHAPDAALIDPRGDTESNYLAREVFTKVMELPEAQRVTVMLVFVEGYAYREAAEVLDVPIGTVMSRLSAARAKLRDAVDGDGKAMEGRT